MTMTIGLIFWILMLLWFVAWIGAVYGPGTYPWGHANSVLLFILLFLLGWHAFGFAVRA